MEYEKFTDRRQNQEVPGRGTKKEIGTSNTDRGSIYMIGRLKVNKI